MISKIWWNQCLKTKWYVYRRVITVGIIAFDVIVILILFQEGREGGTRTLHMTEIRAFNRMRQQSGRLAIHVPESKHRDMLGTPADVCIFVYVHSFDSPMMYRI